MKRFRPISGILISDIYMSDKMSSPRNTGSPGGELLPLEQNILMDEAFMDTCVQYVIVIWRFLMRSFRTWKNTTSAFLRVWNESHADECSNSEGHSPTGRVVLSLKS